MVRNLHQATRRRVSLSIGADRIRQPQQPRGKSLRGLADVPRCLGLGLPCEVSVFPMKTFSWYHERLVPAPPDNDSDDNVRDS